MSFSRKLLHFVYSIKYSIPSIIVGIILTLTVIIVFPKVSDNSLSLSFVAGIFASVIATILLKITERFSSSIAAHSTMVYRVDTLVSFVESNVNEDNYNSQKCKDEMINYYFSICEKYEEITYKKDYNRISKAVRELIDSCNKGKNYKDVSEATERLKELVSSVQ